MKIATLLTVLLLICGCGSENRDEPKFKEPSVTQGTTFQTKSRKSKPSKNSSKHLRLEEQQRDALGITSEDSILDVIDKATGGMSK